MDIMVIGPNQKLARGRLGLSRWFMYGTGSAGVGPTPSMSYWPIAFWKMFGVPPSGQPLFSNSHTLLSLKT